MIEVHHVLAFLTVMEEGSFSRAAEKLGLVQSAVSQKLKRLEDQLGFKLIERTSRQLRLSEEALEFLPYARQMLKAEDNARAAAKRIAQRLTHTLRLGGYAFQAEERLHLMQHYMSAAPHARIEVEHGSRSELLRMLEDETIDAFLCLAVAGSPMEEFDGILLRRSVAQIVVPSGHTLAGRRKISLDQLANVQIAISPGRLDAPVLDHVCEQLTAHEAILVPAPEADRRAIAAFAKVHRLPSLRWLPEGFDCHEETDECTIPIENNPLVTELYLYTRTGRQRPLVEEFRTIVRKWASPQSEARSRPNRNLTL